MPFSASKVSTDLKRYFTNIAVLNKWDSEYSRRILLCSLRGQAESYAYGLPENVQGNLNLLFDKL